MKITCECGSALEIPEEVLGHKVRCPACQAVFTAWADSSRSRARDEIQVERPEPPQWRDEPERERPGRPADVEPRRQPRDDARRSRVKESSGKALASLICGFAGCLGIPAIIGVILGAVALSDCKKNKYLLGRGMAIAGIILSVSTLLLSMLLSVFVASAMQKAFQDAVGAQPGARAGGTQAMVRNTFRFNCPSGWHGEDKGNNRADDFAVYSPSMSLMLFLTDEGLNNLDQTLEMHVHAQKIRMTRTSTTEFTKWGKYEGKGVILKGKVRGYATTIRLFVFHAGPRTYFLMQYEEDDQIRECAAGFKMIEESFEVLK